MWYAPIGSLEYIKNLHNDILIKKYILSEQRLKQQNQTSLKKKNRLLLIDLKSKKLNTMLVETKKKTESLDIRKNRIKGCAVDIIIKRSFKKTHLDVITYDSTKKL